MANGKLNVKKLIGSFNQYLDSNSTLSFSDYVKTEKVGFFAKNSHVNVMEFNQKKDKYEEFLNYLIENDKEIKNDKLKAIAIRQIRAESLDNNQKINIKHDKQLVGKILSRSPVPTDRWHKTKYVVRKTGKTLLMTALLSTAIGAGFGLVAAWGVGLIPGMTGNVLSNFATAFTHGALIGGGLGLGGYSLTYLVQKAKIKRLGKRDKENFNKLNQFDLNTTKDLETLNIPLMTLVNDFIEDRQESKELRTSKNPFNILKHRRNRDLNYIRFYEITESFGQLIDSLEKSGNTRNAHIVKEYYCNKFASLFSHPDFARIANKFSIDKKLSNEASSSKRMPHKRIVNNINDHDLSTNNSAFVFGSSPKPKSSERKTRKFTQPTAKASKNKKADNLKEPVVEVEPSTTEEQLVLTNTNDDKTPLIFKDAKPKQTRNIQPKQKPINTAQPFVVAEEIIEEPIVFKTKETPITKEEPIIEEKTVLDDSIVEHNNNNKKTSSNEKNLLPSMFDLYPEIEQDNKIFPIEEKTSESKADTINTIVQKKDKKQEGEKISKSKTSNPIDKVETEAVLIIENEVLDILKDKESNFNTNLAPFIGVTEKAVASFIRMGESLHFGQNPITGKDSKRLSIASVIQSKKYKEKFPDLTEDSYKKIMDFALGNVNIADEI